MSIMNSVVKDIFERVCLEAMNLNRKNGNKTLSSKDVQAAVKLLIPGELSKHAISEGTKAITKYCTKF